MEKTPKPKTYTSTEDVYVGGEYTKAGRPFTTDVAPSKSWTAVSETEAAAITASTEHVPDDAELDALPLTALKAVAFLRRVQGIDKLDADGLKTAIRASYEPAL